MRPGKITRAPKPSVAASATSAARPSAALTWPTRARARTATVHWLEAVYNRQRRHSAIDMQSPVEYEERYWDRRAAA